MYSVIAEDIMFNFVCIRKMWMIFSKIICIVYISPIIKSQSKKKCNLSMKRTVNKQCF